MFTIPTKTFDEVIDFSKKSPDGADLDVAVSQQSPDFTVNSHGWVLNDISALQMAQNAREAELLIKRIQVYEASNPDTSKMSVVDLIRTVSPRSAQCPSELARAAQYVSDYIQTKADAEVARREALAAAQQQRQQQQQQQQQQQTVPDINV